VVTAQTSEEMLWSLVENDEKAASVSLVPSVSVGLGSFLARSLWYVFTHLGSLSQRRC